MVEAQHFCLRWNNYQSSITSAFENLRDDEDFVDVTLACDGKSLKAHRVVLSACSPYFRELLKVRFKTYIHNTQSFRCSVASGISAKFHKNKLDQNITETIVYCLVCRHIWPIFKIQNDEWNKSFCKNNIFREITFKD